MSAITPPWNLEPVRTCTGEGWIEVPLDERCEWALPSDLISHDFTDPDGDWMGCYTANNQYTPLEPVPSALHDYRQLRRRPLRNSVECRPKTPAILM